MKPDISRRIAAEWLGTACLLTAIVGSGIMAERLATGSPALALLANTLATAAVLVVLITAFAPISGAHFNPAVTLALAARGEIRWRTAAAYGSAQLSGAVAGVWLAHLMFGAPLLEWGGQERSGPGLWLSEAVATFGLVLTILTTRRATPAAVPLVVGLYILAAYWFTASTSFPNPAVTLARALTDSFAGIRPLDVPLFVVAQLAGTLAAVALGHWLLADREPLRSS